MVKPVSVSIALCLALALGAAGHAAAAHRSGDSRILVVLDPTTDFLLTLTPMLREGPETELLVASESHRACIEQRLQSAGRTEVWVLAPENRAPQPWKIRHRLIQGAAKEVLDAVRPLCHRQSSTVVLADRANPQQAMLGCLLATAHRAPLYLIDRKQPLSQQLKLNAAPIRRVFCMGPASDWKGDTLPEKALRSYVSDPQEVQSTYTNCLSLQQTAHLCVVKIPGTAADQTGVPYWSLAVPYALRHRAAILLVKEGTDLESQITEALTKKYVKARYVTLFGDEANLPPVRIPDPAAQTASTPRRSRPGPRVEADRELPEHVEDPEDTLGTSASAGSPGGTSSPAMVGAELLSGGRYHQPCTYRAGRITGDSLATASLLASSVDLSPPPAPGKSFGGWMMANIGNKNLPMLECIARATEKTFFAHGWLLATRYGAASPAIPIERFLKADLVVYQGHTADLGEFSKVSQQAPVLPPSLFLLQGCVSLQQGETMSLLRRGAAGVVGSTSNMFSASGAAFAKALIDSLTDGYDAGTSLMIARNYMLALSVMKENRGHQQCGRPLRTAMTFGLWGDPTWKLPSGSGRLSRTDRVYAVRRGSRAEVRVPASWPQVTQAGAYRALNPLEGKLSGVYTAKPGPNAEKQLIPQYFAVLPMEDWDRPEGARAVEQTPRFAVDQPMGPAQPLALPAGLGQSRAG